MYYNEMDETLDLRIRRTHKLLSNALLSLLTEKSFDDIHISDICDEAMVHRTTFYKHFEDKYDLFNFSLKQLARIFEDKSIEYAHIEDGRLYFVNIFRLLLEHIYENKNMFLIGLRGLKNDATIKIIQNLLVERTKSKLEISETNGIVFIIPIPIFAEFYSAGIISLASWWIANNMPISIDEMVKYGDAMINKMVE